MRVNLDNSIMMNNAVLIIGAGIAGMEASLMLADAGKKVYLVERELYIGGNVIKYEDVFSNMECATCLIAPKQQEVLQHDNIDVLTLSEVKHVQGTCGDFVITIEKKARYVSLVDCIGCEECFGACPVSVPNEFEQGLGQRKAIYTPCPGTLPNVPRIDPEHCLRFKGQKCQACREACLFEAINYDQQDEELTLHVDAVILATGFSPQNPEDFPQYGYGLENVYTAFQFERMFASNGETQGEIVLKNGNPPKNAAIIYGVGIRNNPYPPTISTMYSLKFIHYLKEKIPEIGITEFYNELCVPGKSYQHFLEHTKITGAEFIRADDITVTAQDGKNVIIWHNETEGEKSIEAEMVIIATPFQPRAGASGLATMFGIAQTHEGFFANAPNELSSVVTSKKGIFMAGCAAGPKDIQDSVAQAQAAAGRVLALYDQT